MWAMEVTPPRPAFLAGAGTHAPYLARSRRTDQVENIGHNACRGIVRDNIAAVIAITASGGWRRHFIHPVRLRYRPDHVCAPDRFARYKYRPPPITPAVRVASIVSVEMRPIVVPESEIAIFFGLSRRHAFFTIPMLLRLTRRHASMPRRRIISIAPRRPLRYARAGKQNCNG